MPTASAAWDAATGQTPWSATCTGIDDTIFADGFDDPLADLIFADGFD